MSSEVLRFTIPPELEGRRLDQALALLCPAHSRARLQDWIRAGRVQRQGLVPRPKDRVHAGEEVILEVRHELVETEPEAEAIPIRVIHEDASLLVVDKPAGLVVHPGAGNRAHTLLNALLHYDPGLRRVARAGIVQRLDKDTSGLMVIARTPEAHTCLAARLKKREIRREYLAVVTGRLTAGGRVEEPIGRHPRERRRMAIVPGGRPAVTHYRIEQRLGAYTLLRVRLETGRTHQIRVHMAHLRHPVVGDPVYGGRLRIPRGASEALRRELRAFRRQALHASDLQLVHPVSGATLHWNVPLPEDMQRLIHVLGESP